MDATVYLPRHFEIEDPATLQSLIRSAPLGTLVIHSANGISVDHIPFVPDSDTAAPGLLRAHIPRANPLGEVCRNGAECVVIFHGPNGYISPSWYATKAETGKVVPTWNYCVVHAHGYAKTVDDRDWVLSQIQELTLRNEVHREPAWAVSDAPESYVSRLIASLIGIEIVVERLIGKFKLSQNQPAENQRSVLNALESEESDKALLEMMRSTLCVD